MSRKLVFVLISSYNSNMNGGAYESANFAEELVFSNISSWRFDPERKRCVYTRARQYIGPEYGDKLWMEKAKNGTEFIPES